MEYQQNGSSVAAHSVGSTAPLAGDAPMPTVLVADDEAVVRTVLNAMLRRLGCNVMLAGDGQEALEIYQSNFAEIDLVIFDLFLPDMTGELLFPKLRTINPQARAVLTTGHSESEMLADL